MATPALLRVVEREARVYRRLWRGLAFSTFLTPVLFLAAMGLGLGHLVNQHSGPVDGLDYLDFVAPGLLVASATQLASGEAMWPVLAGVKWIRFYTGVVVTPIGAGQLYGGVVVWQAIRTLIASTVFLIVAALLGAIPSAWGVLAIPASALTASAAVALLAGFSISQDSDLPFPVITRLVILPLFLFSGTFFPISQLPRGLRVFAVLSPLWHGVSLARDATTGSFHVLADIGHVVALVVFILIGAFFGVRNFGRRLCA
jgi:lipooligosaccharide transport system permease protein